MNGTTDPSSVPLMLRPHIHQLRALIDQLARFFG
jgi:hypothetical protein